MKKETLTLEEMFCKTKGHIYVTKYVIDLSDDDINGAFNSRGLKVLQSMYKNMPESKLTDSLKTIVDYCTRCKNWRDHDDTGVSTERTVT